MKKWLKWILIVIGGLAVGFSLLMFQPWALLPHKKPVLILPIESKYDSQAGLMPLGEKINHPNAPGGHPGIDFGFDKVTENIPYIAAMGGKVSEVRIYDNNEKSEGDKKPISKKKADVTIASGAYKTVYAEMDGDTLPSNIKVGTKLKQGDIVGYGNFMTGDKQGNKREMIHWEFKSASLLVDRLCPLTYFTDESRQRIEKIWAIQDWPEMKSRYPLICNGDYEGKAEK